MSETLPTCLLREYTGREAEDNGRNQVVHVLAARCTHGAEGSHRNEAVGAQNPQWDPGQ